MRMYDLIAKKRDGGELEDLEIREMITAFTAGSIPDYQMAAFAMAVFFRGMSDRETDTLTDAMAKSGDSIDLSRFGTLSVDKHSTGGVGDKTTLVVAPLVASLGGKVAKISGRGLGHTGGTVDKLESIPGFCTSLEEDAFLEQVARVGVAVVGQTANLAPADKKLYALRDVTATVNSIPLIVSSILSKKLAAGAHSIVLDVKCGSGSFCKTYEQAHLLAAEMVRIGESCGRRMAAVITDMDLPLGCAVGNALEVREALDVLHGQGHADLREVCLVLASHMLTLCRGMEPEESRAAAEQSLADGTALAKFRAWIAAQGGDAAVADDPSRLPLSALQQEIRATEDGFLCHMDTEKIGIASVQLGAGRTRKEDAVDHGAGLLLAAKPGDRVKKGDRLATMYASDGTLFAAAAETFRSALTFGPEKPAHRPLILGVLGGKGGKR